MADKVATQQKPDKPYPEFPLFPHATRRWAKKILGKLHYFGPWHDPDGALDKYLRQKDDLHAGRTPRIRTDGITLFQMCNLFLDAKRKSIETGELSERSWKDYKRTALRIVRVFGESRMAEDLGPEDFAFLREDMAKSLKLVALGNEVARVKVIFNYAAPDKAGLMREHPRFGVNFKRPSKKSLRIHRASKPKKLFSAHELRTLLYASGPQLSAMCWLAANCGFGNSDCANLLVDYLDLKAGWLEYSRPKTGIFRRAKLWPETIAAIEKTAQATAKRRVKVDAETARFVFLTSHRQPWVGSTDSCPISQACRKVLDSTGIYRPGLSFYAIRHTFQTIGDRSKDTGAVSFIMGHADSSMAGVYREEFDDDRLVIVANHVRNWLLPQPLVLQQQY